MNQQDRVRSRRKRRSRRPAARIQTCHATVIGMGGVGRQIAMYLRAYPKTPVPPM